MELPNYYTLYSVQVAGFNWAETLSAASGDRGALCDRGGAVKGLSRLRLQRGRARGHGSVGNSAVLSSGSEDTRSQQAVLGGPLVVDEHVAKNAKRIVRLLDLYYMAVCEFFQRTGENPTHSKKQLDRLRHDVAAVAGDHEWTILYPGEDKTVAGSSSMHDSTRPSIILFWIQMSLRKIADHQAVETDIMAHLLGRIGQLTMESGSPKNPRKQSFSSCRGQHVVRNANKSQSTTPSGNPSDPNSSGDQLAAHSGL